MKKKKKTSPLATQKEIYAKFKKLFPKLFPKMWWKTDTVNAIRIRLDCGDDKTLDIFFNYISDTCWMIRSIESYQLG